MNAQAYYEELKRHDAIYKEHKELIELYDNVSDSMKQAVIDLLIATRSRKNEVKK